MRGSERRAGSTQDDDQGRTQPQGQSRRRRALEERDQMNTFKLKDVRNNPFRDAELNPLNEEKITALRTSIRETGFWNNVLARIGPDGKPQIAYGHHRIEAARQEDIEEVGLIIR